MRSGTTFRYATNAVLKPGNSIYGAGGLAFHTPATARYSNAIELRNTSTGNMLYETGSNLYFGNTFRYQSDSPMIDSSGNPYFSNTTPANFPFSYSNPVGLSTVYTGVNADRIARYAVSIVSATATYVLGGTVDYSVVPPPKPVGLAVSDATANSVTFTLTSGDGTTQDYVYAYANGALHTRRWVVGGELWDERAGSSSTPVETISDGRAMEQFEVRGDKQLGSQPVLPVYSTPFGEMVARRNFKRGMAK